MVGRDGSRPVDQPSPQPQRHYGHHDPQGQGIAVQSGRPPRLRLEPATQNRQPDLGQDRRKAVRLAETHAAGLEQTDRRVRLRRGILYRNGLLAHRQHQPILRGRDEGRAGTAHPDSPRRQRDAADRQPGHERDPMRGRRKPQSAKRGEASSKTMRDAFFASELRNGRCIRSIGSRNPSPPILPGESVRG